MPNKQNSKVAAATETDISKLYLKDEEILKADELIKSVEPPELWQQFQATSEDVKLIVRYTALLPRDKRKIFIAAIEQECAL